MWVYDGTFPGPTFEVDSFQKIHVVFTNNLPMDTPLLPQSDLGMTSMINLLNAQKYPRINSSISPSR